jgi:hypothetical protein
LSHFDSRVTNNGLKIPNLGNILTFNKAKN